MVSPETSQYMTAGFQLQKEGSLVEAADQYEKASELFDKEGNAAMCLMYGDLAKTLRYQSINTVSEEQFVQKLSLMDDRSRELRRWLMNVKPGEGLRGIFEDNLKTCEIHRKICESELEAFRAENGDNDEMSRHLHLAAQHSGQAAELYRLKAQKEGYEDSAEMCSHHRHLARKSFLLGSVDIVQADWTGALEKFEQAATEVETARKLCFERLDSLPYMPEEIREGMQELIDRDMNAVQQEQQGVAQFIADISLKKQAVERGDDDKASQVDQAGQDEDRGSSIRVEGDLVLDKVDINDSVLVRSRIGKTIEDMVSDRKSDDDIKCPGCGIQAEQGHKFCPECGRLLEQG